MKKLFLPLLLVAGLTLTSCNQDEIDNLNNTIEQRDATIAGLQSELADANSDISSLEGVIRELQASNSGLTIQLSEAQALAAELGDNLNDANASIESLNAQVDELNAIIAETQAELASVQADNAAQAAQISELQTALADALATNSDNEALIAGLRADLDAARAAAGEEYNALIEGIRAGFLFLYAPSLDTDGDGYSNILTSDREDTGFDLNDEGLTDSMLLDSFNGFVRAMGG